MNKNKAAAFLSDLPLPLHDFVDSDERDSYLKYKPRGCAQVKRVPKRKRIKSEQPQEEAAQGVPRVEFDKWLSKKKDMWSSDRMKRKRSESEQPQEEAAQGVPRVEFDKWLSKRKDLWSSDRRRRQEEKVAQELARQLEEEAAREEEKVARRHEEEKVAQETLTALLQIPHISRAQAPGIGWPSEEDAHLLEVMANHKRGTSVDWEGLCVEHGMAGRSARECHNRWTRYLRPGRAGHFSEQEDVIVLRAIFSGGFSSKWQDLAPQLPGRTANVIRHRWVNFLNPALNTLPFSRDDDCRLWRGHKELGKRWPQPSRPVFVVLFGEIKFGSRQRRTYDVRTYFRSTSSCK
jgi:hypothetical protein